MKKSIMILDISKIVDVKILLVFHYNYLKNGPCDHSEFS